MALATSSHSHEGLGYFPHLVGTRSSYKHLGESLGDMRFVATVAFKRLGVELTFTISGHFDLLQPPRRCRQVTCVRAVAIAFPLGTTFSLRSSNEGI